MNVYKIRQEHTSKALEAFVTEFRKKIAKISSGQLARAVSHGYNFPGADVFATRTDPK